MNAADRIEQAVADAFQDRSDDLADAVRKALQAELPAMLCAAVRDVLAEHPDLGKWGFGTAPLSPNDDDFVAQVGAALAWIRTTPNAAKLLKRRSSYMAKHVAERHARTYIGNAALIAAAALEGFRPVRSAGASPNCRFMT